MKLPHWDAPPEALRLVRRLVFATWFLRVAFKPLDQLALIPSSLFTPVGPLAFLPRRSKPCSTAPSSCRRSRPPRSFRSPW